LLIRVEIDILDFVLRVYLKLAYRDFKLLFYKVDTYKGLKKDK